MRKNIYIVTIIMMVWCLMLTGCGNKEIGQGQWDGTLKIALHQDPPNLDPCFSTAAVDRQVFQGIFDTLVTLDEKGNIKPMLADSWDISPDGLVYIFHLHKGIVFHDDTPFNADAVVFNIKENLKKSSSRKSELSFVSDVETIDANTVKIILKKPFSPFLSVLTDRAGMMRSPAAVKKYGKDFMNHPIGTGPFIFESRLKGDSITLTQNPHYWNHTHSPKAKKIVYKIIDDPNVALVNLKSGQVDFSDYLPFNQINDYKNDPIITASDEPALGFNGFFLNTKSEAFSDIRVRKAIDLLIDREAIVNVALSGVGTPGRTAFPEMNFAHDVLDTPQKPNVEKAKELLKAAGKNDGFSFTLCTDTNPINQTMAQMLQKMMYDGGIDMKIQKVDFGTLLAKGKRGHYEAIVIQWSGRIDPDQNIYSWLYSGASNNYAAYSNPHVDAALEAARASQDILQRKQLYHQMDTYLDQDVPYIFLYHAHNLYGMRRNVKGYIPNPDGMIKPVTIYKEGN